MSSTSTPTPNPDLKKTPRSVRKTRVTVYRTALSAMLLALAVVLPLLTGQIPDIGNAFCPMHLPVFLCGFFCGPLWALCIGFIAPFLRFLIFGMPTIIPKGLAMAFELAAYGALAGLLYRILPKKKIFTFVSLLGAMIGGRLVWGAVSAVLYGFGLGKQSFGFHFFITESIVNALPGIAVQIVLIPALVMLLGDKFIPEDRGGLPKKRKE